MSDIQSAYPLIRNKVASPHYVTPTLRRGRLLDWLHEHANSRAVVIAADAGYGKTTLLWQWEREVKFPCYWYKLDRNDRDWTLHVSYLAQAVALRHPDFGRRTHAMLQQVTGPGTSRPGIAAYLLAEMHDRLTEPCTFIVDDWQYVNAVTEVRGLWNQILRDAPPTCRFVFASRMKPTLQFARFKTHGGYAALDTDALRFTPDEVEQLFREIYDEPLEPAELRKLEQRTEGWAASLHLVSVTLRDRTDEQRKEFIETVSASSNTDLFEFLAQEVVDQETAETRNLLLSTSILQQITPELAERLAGVHDGSRELVALERRGLFTYQLDEGRYRYHNLFREYLERRLIHERSEAEVTGLHIHAASYFETSEQWPEAIHHYLKAGLHRQAARLLARHGEQLVAEGRIDLIGEWLEELPKRTVRDNARLSLLLGEFAGFRSDWSIALDALKRARSFFAKKGDRRMEALACLKLSSIYHYHGDAELAADAAREGLELVPADDIATRLRLEGNLAITHGLLHDTLESVAATCRRIAEEASRHGLDHFAAIGYHNLGDLQMMMLKVPEALENLRRAADFWETLPPNPFDELSALIIGLLVANRPDEAERVAVRSTERTAAWRLPNLGASRGMAEVLMYRGRFKAAVDLLAPVHADQEALGYENVGIGWPLVKGMYFSGADPDDLDSVIDRINAGADDERHVIASLPAAIAMHARPDCAGRCQDPVTRLRKMESRGYRLLAVEGILALASFALEHRRRDGMQLLHEAVSKAADAGILRYVRWWTRRCTGAAHRLARMRRGVELLVALLRADPEAWRQPIASSIPNASPTARAELLAALTQYPSRDTVEALRSMSGQDVSEARRDLVHQLAPHLYVRTFGALTIHRGSWNGSPIEIDKRRLRQLLSLLAAHTGRALTRDEAADILWPEADAISAGNNLNQAVFQLRRLLDPSHRDGESPSYVATANEIIQLNPELVHTDLADVKRLATGKQSNGAPTGARLSATLDLVRGEFLPELKYEDWGSGIQSSVHADVRSVLLPIAERARAVSSELAVRAACALVEMDPYDERAHIAMAAAMARGGRRVAAREGLKRYAARIRRDFDEEPSEALADALLAL